VKVLVADVREGVVTPVWEVGEQTRLGRGFYDSHRLQHGPIAATVRAVAHFASEARARGAQAVRVIATSAARDAVNRDELLTAIREASGLEAEVISGEQEAEWGFLGVTSAPGLAGQRLLILDVGGGSTEFILGHAGHLDYRESFPLGSVRVFERFRPADAPSPAELAAVRGWLREFLRTQVTPRLSPYLAADGPPDRVIGVGGTMSILALIRHARRDFDREVIEATRFTRAELTALTERLWSTPLADRRQLPGLPPERADVILTGAAIYEAVLDTFEFPVLGVSTRGLRFAAL